MCLLQSNSNGHDSIDSGVYDHVLYEARALPLHLFSLISLFVFVCVCICEA